MFNVIRNVNIKTTHSLNQPNWQVNVLSFGKFVVKFPKTRNQRMKAIRSSRLAESLTDDRLSSLLLETAISLQKSFLILSNSPHLQNFCGSPYIIFDKLIIQKRGRTFLSLRTDNSTLELIDHFFTLNQEIWKIGVFEGTFDFLRNCGILPNGDPFFIDLGDFSTETEKFYTILSEKRWEYRLDYQALSAAERQYFDALANDIFSLKNFKTKWRSNLDYE